jgi:hypothetical protein
MTQALYAHMNNKRKKQKVNKNKQTNKQKPNSFTISLPCSQIL